MTKSLFKLPRTIKIEGEVWKIEQDRESNGASLSYRSGTMIIGSAMKKWAPGHQLNALIHEVAEIILINRGIRYDHPLTGGDYRFYMNHNEFDGFITELTAAIQPIVKGF